MLDYLLPWTLTGWVGLVETVDCLCLAFVSFNTSVSLTFTIFGDCNHIQFLIPRETVTKSCKWIRKICSSIMSHSLQILRGLCLKKKCYSNFKCFKIYSTSEKGGLWLTKWSYENSLKIFSKNWIHKTKWINAIILWFVVVCTNYNIVPTTYY